MKAKEAKIHIACSVDDNYTQHCGVMLCSLFENNPEEIFTIYILTEGISDTNKRALERIVQNYQQGIRIININTLLLANAPLHGHISKASFYRILIPKYIPGNIDRVIYLDIDLIVRKNITALWQENVDQVAMAACINPNMISHKSLLGLPNKSRYFNAGVLLINLMYWREHKIEKRLIECVSINSKRLKYWDQDALNIILHDQVKILSNKWNATESFFIKREEIEDEYDKEVIDKIFEDPFIVHFTGESKPWHLENRHPYKQEYYKYLGMTPWKGYSPIIDRLSRFVKKGINRIIH